MDVINIVANENMPQTESELLLKFLKAIKMYFKQ